MNFFFTSLRKPALQCVLAAGSVGFAISAWAQMAPPQERCEVAYQMKEPGFVTLAIDDANGQRVRNLVSSGWREAGAQRDQWDGLDDAGKPVPMGEYRWKGMTHGGIGSYFVGAFNAPGDPPWITAQTSVQRGIRAGGSGGWLSDHERPIAAYAGGGRIYFGAEIAEAGHSIIELDADGKKLWGTLWMSLSGANAIARDGDVLYVAGEKGWMKDSLAVNRLEASTHQWIPNPKGVAFKMEQPAFIKVKSADFSEIRGMVVTSGFIVLSLADHDRLACFSTQDGSHLKDIPLPGAGALVKLRDGGLLAISGRDVVRVDLENGQHQLVISGSSSSLLQPAGLGVDSIGRIVVSDSAPEEQCVKIFSPEGSLLGRIGKPGGRSEGRFDPQAMDHPRALAIDERDQVWVGEFSYQPKRISVWKMDGSLVREMIGPSYYGGGGALDPRNAERAFYKGMEFSVAPWPERSTLKSVLFRPEEHTDLPYPAPSKGSKVYDSLPDAPVYRGDRLYLMNDDGYGVKAVLIGEVVQDRLVPRVIFGPYRTLAQAWRDLYPDFIQSMGSQDPKAGAMGVFLWQDLNGDGKADPSEVTLEPDWKFGAEWAVRSWPTLNLYARRGKELIAVAPESGDGSLRYDFKKATAIPLPEAVQRKGFTALAPDLEGNLLINCGGGGNQGDPLNVFMSLSPKGQVRWTYPSPYPSNCHNSPRPQVGDIQHVLNVEGIASLGGEIGDIFQLNGNKGTRYLFTTDGLFITQLFGDMRNFPLFSSLDIASKALRMDQYSLSDECFFGWLGKANDGRILQIVGKSSCNVLEVRGLDSLHRLKGGALQLKKVAQAREDNKESAVPVKTVQLGGIPTGWEKVATYRFPSVDPIARFAIGYQAYDLHLSIEVDKPGPFANAGEDPKTLFKSGDAIDFRFAAQPDGADAPSGRSVPAVGDQRFVFATYQGEPVAVRYRFVVPGANEASQVKFASPTGVAVVDEVGIQKEVQVSIEQTAKGYRLKARIPWKVLGLSKAPEGEMRGDIGVIVSDPSGSQGAARYYYFDQTSQVVSDLPSEVRVNPSKWGKLSF